MKRKLIEIIIVSIVLLAAAFVFVRLTVADNRIMQEQAKKIYYREIKNEY